MSSLHCFQNIFKNLKKIDHGRDRTPTLAKNDFSKDLVKYYNVDVRKAVCCVRRAVTYTILFAFPCPLSSILPNVLLQQSNQHQVHLASHSTGISSFLCSSSLFLLFLLSVSSLSSFYFFVVLIIPFIDLCFSNFVTSSIFTCLLSSTCCFSKHHSLYAE